MPDLNVTESMLRQAALNQVAKCIAQAKLLDDHDASDGAASTTASKYAR